MHNINGHNCIVHSLAVNADNVMASGGDTGNIHMWDYKTGHNFCTLQTVAQPGSLESERGIFALAFDQSGSRLITGMHVCMYACMYVCMKVCEGCHSVLVRCEGV